MIINKYYFNDKLHESFKEDLNCDQIGLEVQFKFITNSIIHDLNKILENYQIKIVRCVDGNYVKNFFSSDMEISEMTHKILSGYNQNEITFVTKNTKKLAFFEKFFQLFS